MDIHGGTNANYYRCVDQKKRGTCHNKLSLREDLAKRRLLDVVEQRYRNPDAILYLRKRIAEKLGELSRQANAELAERRGRLQRTEEKIAALVHFISEGDQSDYVRKSLLDLEAQVKAEKAAIAGLISRATMPIELPSPEFALRNLVAFRQQVEDDPVRARETMRRFFDQGRLHLLPQPEGYYVAQTKFYPMAMLRFLEEDLQERRRFRAQNGLDHRPGGLWSRESCAGLQLDFPAQQYPGVAEVWVPFDEVIAVGWT